jgi:hypothetical protein
VPADPSLPDSQRDVQFTVNGQFQPVIKSKARQAVPLDYVAWEKVITDHGHIHALPARDSFQTLWPPVALAAWRRLWLVGPVSARARPAEVEFGRSCALTFQSIVSS